MKNKQIGSMAAAKMIDNMSVFEAARWQALMDAVELIYEKSVDRKMDFNKIFYSLAEILIISTWNYYLVIYFLTSINY